MSHPEPFNKESTRGETLLGHFVDQVLPERHLTPKHSRNNNQRVRHHWGIVWKTRKYVDQKDMTSTGSRPSIVPVVSHPIYDAYVPHTTYKACIRRICATAQTPLRDASVQGPPLRLNCAEKLYITMVLLIFRFATTNWTSCCCCCCCLSWEGVTPDSLL